MKELLEYIIKSLVDNKDAVSVVEKADEKSIVFEVKVDSSEMGKIIGKQGRIAKAIRTLIKSIATKERKKVSVEILD